MDFFLHLDKYLSETIQAYGVWTYAILFLVIFCETGLVVTPFLPGDSLLFAAGMLAHPQSGHLNLAFLIMLLFAASFIGDNTNFWIGKKLGMKLFQKEDSRIFKRSHLEKTRAFYEKHGRKTIIVGRYVPIVRTFAPFVAGLDAMDYRKFVGASLIGSASWVTICTVAGYTLGSVKIVRDNFSLAIMGVVVLSFAGIFVEILRNRIKARRQTP